LRKAADRAAKNNFTEDWLAVIIGVFVFALALFSLSSADLIGWAVTTSVRYCQRIGTGRKSPCRGSAAALRGF
jgi:hypothetical protein